MDNVFCLRNILPDFKLLFNGNSHSSEWLTALFVSILLAVFLISFIYAFHKFFFSLKHIKFYKILLNGLTQDQLAYRQREMTQKALENKKIDYGNIWREFDETLVYSPDGSRLFNTLDAAHFFNTSSLSKGLTENRLLAAVPGFLTALGVIGTFIGLTMGLTSLQIQQDAGVDVLRQGIGNMISGASIAFLTSVWGVSFSVIFNLLEKIMERYIRKQIVLLQNKIDFLYPRINPEQSLVKILDYNRSSNETLQGLSEKIGDRLQEALSHTTSSIREGLEDSLNKIMAPAIQSLVDNANQGTKEAFENLMNRFLEGVGDAGKTQCHAMESASQGVRDAMGHLESQMTDFLSSLQVQTNTIR